MSAFEIASTILYVVYMFCLGLIPLYASGMIDFPNQNVNKKKKFGKGKKRNKKKV